MKRKIAFVLLTLFVISFSLIALAACGDDVNNDDITNVGGSENPDNSGDPGDDNNGGSTEQSKCIPVYQGMTITNNNTAISLTSASYRYDGVMLLGAANENNGNNGNHYGQYKGDHANRDDVLDNDNPYPDNSDSENIEEEIKSSLNVVGATNEIYYATSNQDVYINIHIYNPDNFEIMSFTLNGKKYSSYMFEEGSDMETVVLKYNVGAVSGIVEYTIDAIKYVDGTEIKDVIIDGDKTVKAGIKTDDQLTASVSGVGIDTNALSFNANIVDKDNLIAFSSGTLKAVIYDGREIVAQRDLTLGENSITFENLKTNTTYQYAIVGYYDDLSGDGFKMNVLCKDVFKTEAILLFDNIEVGKTDIYFEFFKNPDISSTSVSTIKLYKDGALVREFSPDTNRISELLSNNTYMLVAEYNGTETVESIYLEFTTACKNIPDYLIENTESDKESLKFSITVTDEDSVGSITKVELLLDGEVVKILDNATTHEITELLSNNDYTLRVTYTYDLNDGIGAQVLIKELSAKTIIKGTPDFVISKIYKTTNSISFEIVETDSDNVGEIVKIELVHKNGTIVASSTEVREFAELLSNNDYTIKVTYTYDLNDGDGVKTIEKTADVKTDANTVPIITIDSVVTSTTSISYRVSEIDENDIGKIEKIELLIGDVIVCTATDGTVRGFEDLLSNTEYTVRLTYVYNLGDGSADVPITKTVNVKTNENIVPFIFLTAADHTKTSIKFEVMESDTNNIGRIEKIELYHGDTFVKAVDNVDAREFTDLLSNTTYTVKVTYIYNLNVGGDDETITRDIDIATDAMSAPVVEIEDVHCEKNSIHLEISNEDADNTTTKIEATLYFLKSGEDHLFIETKQINKTCSFDQLQYKTGYLIKVIAYYDLNDGGGEKSTAVYDKAIETPYYVDEQGNSYSFDYKTGRATLSVANKDAIDIIIPSEIEGFTVTVIRNDAFAGCVSLQTVSMPKTVEAINAYAFRGCSSLKSITIPDSVKSIGNGAFAGCISLESITLPIAFANTPNQSPLPNYPIGYIFGNAFYEGCVATQQVYINPSTGTQTSGRYYIPSSLKSVTVTGGLIAPGTFYGCAGLSNVTIQNGTTGIGDNAFYGCTSLSTISIPDSVEKIGQRAFHGCTGLKNVIIGNGVTDIGNDAFHSCTNLMSVTIGTNVNSIATRVFSNCSRLIEIVNNSSLSMSSVPVPTGSVDIHTGDSKLIVVGDYIFYDSDINYLVSYEGDESVLTLPDNYHGENYAIYKYTFSNNTKIKSVIISNSTTSIGDYAFLGCTSLTNITIPNGVANIGASAFSGCTSLANVSIGNGVTSIGSYAFSGCDSLTSVYVIDMASWCNITFGNVDANPFSSGVDIYVNGKILTDLVIPEGVTAINSYAFYGCTGLTSVSIPDSVTTIGVSAFTGCSNLTQTDNGVMYIDKWAVGFTSYGAESFVTLRENTVGIADNAFYGCTDLMRISIPNGVKTIGNYAFFNCTGLTEVVIGKDVTVIGARSFQNCSNLMKINFRGTMEEWYAVSKLTGWNTNSGRFAISYNYKGE